MMCSMIFVEKDTPLPRQEIDKKLELLRRACETGNNDHVRETVKISVLTSKSAENVNADAERFDEMKSQRVRQHL